MHSVTGLAVVVVVVGAVDHDIVVPFANLIYRTQFEFSCCRVVFVSSASTAFVFFTTKWKTFLVNMRRRRWRWRRRWLFFRFRAIECNRDTCTPHGVLACQLNKLQFTLMAINKSNTIFYIFYICCRRRRCLACWRIAYAILHTDWPSLRSFDVLSPSSHLCNPFTNICWYAACAHTHVLRNKTTNCALRLQPKWNTHLAIVYYFITESAYVQSPCAVWLFWSSEHDPMCIL